MKNDATSNIVQLNFRLISEESGWPPVSVEGVPARITKEADYAILIPPFFIQDLSVDDVISTIKDEDGIVIEWKHVSKSKRSTIWLLKNDADDLEGVVHAFKNVGANIERFVEFHLISVDLPPEAQTEHVDEVIEDFERIGGAVAFPSYRLS